MRILFTFSIVGVVALLIYFSFNLQDVLLPYSYIEIINTPSIFVELLRLFLIFLVVGGSIWLLLSHKPGNALLYGVVWVCFGSIMMGVYVFYNDTVLQADHIDVSHSKTSQNIPVAGIVEIAPQISRQTPTLRAEPLQPVWQNKNDKLYALLYRNENGHYMAHAQVDGVSTRFLIDTGASTVALSYSDAERIGFKPDTLEYDRIISTAGGNVKGASVVLSEIRINDIQAFNVQAIILASDLEISLLGMNFLNELESYEFNKDMLVLRQ